MVDGALDKLSNLKQKLTQSRDFDGYKGKYIPLRQRDSRDRSKEHVDMLEEIVSIEREQVDKCSSGKVYCQTFRCKKVSTKQC